MTPDMYFLVFSRVTHLPNKILVHVRDDARRLFGNCRPLYCKYYQNKTPDSPRMFYELKRNGYNIFCK